MADKKGVAMACKRSGFLGAFGTAFQVFKALTDEVLSLGGDDEDFRRIETDSGLRRKPAELIVGAKQVAENIFRLTVDYSRSLAEMIAAGHYDWKDSNITEEHFPLPQELKSIGRVEREAQLVHFGGYMTSDKVLAELHKMGLRPATLAELLAFGAAYPDEQRKYFIVALGSVWRRWRVRDVPCLWSNAGGRGLPLGWSELDWSPRCRFLAVRESR